MASDATSKLESMVLSPETLRKREFIMAIAPDLLAGGDPSEPESAIPDIGFEETGDEIVMIDAPEDEPSEPAPTNDRSAPTAPAPRPADTGAAAPTPKAETTSSAIDTRSH